MISALVKSEPIVTCVWGVTQDDRPGVTVVLMNNNKEKNFISWLVGHGVQARGLLSGYGIQWGIHMSSGIHIALGIDSIN